MSSAPDVIIPGHVSAGKLALQRHLLRRLVARATWTSTKRCSPSAKTGVDLWEGMNKAYPGMKAMDFGVQWNARLLFPHSCPDWFPQLPGEPGTIFLDPQGEFVGEPLRATSRLLRSDASTKSSWYEIISTYLRPQPSRRAG